MKNKTDLQFIATKDSIAVCVDGKMRTMLSSNEKFSALKEAIRAKDWDRVVQLIDPIKIIFDRSQGRMGMLNGQIYLKLPSGENWPVPSALNNSILFYMEERLDFDYLVNFGIKLASNPSQHSIEQLYSFLAHNKVAIHPDGDFALYKKVRNDYLDCHTGTIDNSVGKTVKMDRNKVDDNPERTCSAGLHAANWDYAKNFYGAGRMMLLKVNPANVVSVPVDYNNSKIRVCEYYVEREVEAEVSEKEYHHPTSSQEYEDDLDDELEEDDELENGSEEDDELEEREELDGLEEDLEKEISSEQEKVVQHDLNVDWDQVYSELTDGEIIHGTDRQNLENLKRIFAEEDNTLICQTYLRRDKNFYQARSSLMTIRGNRTRRQRGDWDKK